MGENDYAMMAFFTASASVHEPMILQKEEVETGGFYTIKKIKQLISENFFFTPSFLHFFKKQHRRE